MTSAKLRLYGVAVTNTKNVGVHAVSSTTWGETAYVEWDVTSYVQAQRTANATAVSLGLLTTSSFSDTETNINSRENSANKPILIISSK